MAAPDHLSGYQFEVNPEKRQIRVSAGEEPVGGLDWSEDPDLDAPGTGFVDYIHVRESHRRRGVATEMMRRMPVSPIYAEGGEDVGNSELGVKFLAAWEQRKNDR